MRLRPDPPINGLVWISLFAVGSSRIVPEPVLIAIALIVAFPFAISFMLPSGHSVPSDPDAVLLCILIGINAFAWGYGLAWIWRHVFRRYSLRRLLAVMTVIALLLGLLRAMNWNLF
jgi:hypothetical protein